MTRRRMISCGNCVYSFIHSSLPPVRSPIRPLHSTFLCVLDCLWDNRGAPANSWGSIFPVVLVRLPRRNPVWNFFEKSCSDLSEEAVFRKSKLGRHSVVVASRRSVISSLIGIKRNLCDHSFKVLSTVHRGDI